MKFQQSVWENWERQLIPARGQRGCFSGIGKSGSVSDCQLTDVNKDQAQCHWWIQMTSTKMISSKSIWMHRIWSYLTKWKMTNGKCSENFTSQIWYKRDRHWQKSLEIYEAINSSLNWFFCSNQVERLEERLRLLGPGERAVAVHVETGNLWQHNSRDEKKNVVKSSWLRRIFDNIWVLLSDTNQ